MAEKEIYCAELLRCSACCKPQLDCQCDEFESQLTERELKMFDMLVDANERVTTACTLLDEMVTRIHGELDKVSRESGHDLFDCIASIKLITGYNERGN